MKRREFIRLISSAAAAPAIWPLTARAQQAMPAIGVLGAASSRQYATFIDGFHRGLNDAGYVAGRNLAIEYRWADGQYDRLPALATDLVDRRVTAIFTAGSTPATVAAKAATTTIPIVFYVAGDPVQMGLVASLSRPGGNLTGITGLSAEIGPKRLELLHQLLPTAVNLALLVNPTSPAQANPQSQDLQAAARELGLQLHVLRAGTEREIDGVFETMIQLRINGLVIGPDVFFNTRSEQFSALALRYGVPTIYQYREFAAAGGLMSYGTNLADMFRLSGVYTGRILKGEKPADLPVQQATKVELIVNLKTAKALGITVPQSLLLRADEVIE